MNIHKATIILLLTKLAITLNVFNKIVVDDPKALCLDGTPATYYYRQGSSQNKVIINFEEG